MLDTLEQVPLFTMTPKWTPFLPVSPASPPFSSPRKLVAEFHSKSEFLLVAIFLRKRDLDPRRSFSSLHTSLWQVDTPRGPRSLASSAKTSPPCEVRARPAPPLNAIRLFFPVFRDVDHPRYPLCGQYARLLASETRWSSKRDPDRPEKVLASL